MAAYAREACAHFHRAVSESSELCAVPRCRTSFSAKLSTRHLRVYSHQKLYARLHASRIPLLAPSHDASRFISVDPARNQSTMSSSLGLTGALSTTSSHSSSASTAPIAACSTSCTAAATSAGADSAIVTACEGAASSAAALLASSAIAGGAVGSGCASPVAVMRRGPTSAGTSGSSPPGFAAWRAGGRHACLRDG